MPDGTTVVTEQRAKPPMTVAQMTELYIQLRDKIAEIKKTHTAQLEPYAKVMQQLEGKLLDALNSAGLDSMKSEAGTAFKSTERSVVVKDWPKTFAHIKANELWDLLEARVSKTATMAVIEETGQPVPGVEVSSTHVLRVRRS